MKKLKYLGTWLLMSIVISCGGDDEPSDQVDDFDRSVMLANWADNIIIPAYTAYSAELTSLKASANTFIATPDVANLTNMRTNWLSAYQAWQRVEMFEIGKAEELILANYTNIYPADTDGIETNVESGSANLALSSKYDEQGFPALDYMINGLGDTDEMIISKYSTTDSKYSTYLTLLIDRMNDLASQVLADWEGGYRDTFVANNGSSATSSVNKLINDYIFYYEKSLRAGKVGIPAGVFSGSPIPTTIEAFYDADISRELLLISLDAVQGFFNGQHFDGTAQGESLKSYLVYLNTIKDGAKLDQLVNDQFESARGAINALDGNLVTQVNTDNTKMLTAYDELQKLVVLLKVDMVQAINVKIDFVDADGD